MGVRFSSSLGRSSHNQVGCRGSMVHVLWLGVSMIASALSSPAFPQAPPVVAPQAQDGVVVEVTGRGSTPEQARDDGVRQALLQVAGAYVRSESIVVNDELIRERIATHMRGLVDSVEVRGDPVLRAGVFEQSMAVRVLRSPVSKLVEQVVKDSRAVDGAGISARIRAARARGASAAELVGEVMRGFPASVMSIGVGEPKEARVRGVNPSEGEVCLLVLVDVWLDDAKWKDWSEVAAEVFVAAAERTSRIRWSPESAGGGRAAAGDEISAWPLSAEARRATCLTAQPRGTGAGDAYVTLRERVERASPEAVSPDACVACLLPAKRGELLCCEFPPSVCATSWLGMADRLQPSVRVPQMDVRIVGKAGGAVGRRIAQGVDLPGSGALLPAKCSSMSAFGAAAHPSVIGSPEVHVAGGLVPILIVPWLQGRDRWGATMLVERITVPVAFIVPASEVADVVRVEASLGESVVWQQWP
jgi:hypothetical protein